MIGTLKNKGCLAILIFIHLAFLGAVSVQAKARKTPEFNRPTTRHDILNSTHTLVLNDPGTTEPIQYEKYGEMRNIGENNYRYVLTDKNGLMEAAGEGVFPNSTVMRSERYQELRKNNELLGNRWRYADIPDFERGFYKWSTENEDPGVKQFYTALMLERAGHYRQAIKGLYAVALHFPKTVSYTYYKTPWYVGPASLDRITQLLRRHPDISWELIDAKIDVDNRFDNDVRNDEFHPFPGELKAVKRASQNKTVDLSKLKIVKTVGGPKVKLNKFENGHWQLLVDDKPFPVRAITYSVTPVGLSPDRGTWNVSKDWQLIDTNNNGLHDGFFEAFIDKNENNIQDPSEPTIGDAKLLKDLGVNTLRAYHHIYDKKLFQKLYDEYGIMVIVGDLLGGYAVGSGAKWDEGTDYSNPEHRKNMLDSVRGMVEDLKDEPYVLMWMLGNENVYGVANNSDKEPDVFYAFTNEAAALIKELDPTRPVGIANGDLLHLDLIKEKCDQIDVIGGNVYRGEQGFGQHLFMNVRDLTDRPFIVTEYGASAYAEGYTQEQADAFQAMYLANNWEDLEFNMAGSGVGNALGGVLFEYIDEWWKANSDLPLSVQKERPDWYASKSAIYKSLQPDKQDAVPQFGFPFLDGWSYEEFYGLVSQGSGESSPFIRILRPSYHQMKKLWTGQ